MKNLIEKSFEKEQSPEVLKDIDLEKVSDLKIAWDNISWQTKTYLYELKERLEETNLEAADELEAIPESIVPRIVKDTIYKNK